MLLIILLSGADRSVPFCFLCLSFVAILTSMHPTSVSASNRFLKKPVRQSRTTGMKMKIKMLTRWLCVCIFPRWRAVRLGFGDNVLMLARLLKQDCNLFSRHNFDLNISRDPFRSSPFQRRTFGWHSFSLWAPPVVCVWGIFFSVFGLQLWTASCFIFI